MKKRYLQPSLAIHKMGTWVILTGSGVTSGKGIGYGGVDENGTKDPSSRRSMDLWDDEEDE